MQVGLVISGDREVLLSFPGPDEELMDGVRWGKIEAFPSPAYWAYQSLARRTANAQVNYKLGGSLKEEVGACLLGGHGIPAAVGLAAFAYLRSLGIFDAGESAQELIYSALSQPLLVNGKEVRYRFANQKSKYLAAALSCIDESNPPLNSGRELRDWLLRIPGIGLKTASWIARNWLDADDVAILDVHILRAGRMGGFLSEGLTVERHYLELEEQFIAFSKAIGIRTSELDAVIWLEMMSSSTSVRRLLNVGKPRSRVKSASGTRSNYHHANTRQPSPSI